MVHLLKQRPRPELMVLMVQKEVADRLVSAPGSKEYGSLSVLVQAAMEIERVATVSRNCFFPVPNVDSAIIRLKPRKKVIVTIRLSATFERVLRASFGQRRKTLLNALSGSALGLSRAAAARALAAAGIEPQARAESLDAAQFGSLTRAVHSVLSEADQK
jgi:16S rRNA (adenine1518-N6/adenine1519-N6)-dimethyltransferase